MSTNRPFFAELDRFLSQAAEARVSEQPAIEYLQRAATASQHEARRRARRARAIRLLVLALIVVIAVLAIVTIGARLPHLTIQLPGM